MLVLLSPHKEILRSHYKDMRILYESVEWGNEYFVTNDKNKEVFSFRFAVYSSIDGDHEMEEFETEDEALQYVAKRLGRESITKEDIDKWNEEHEDEEDIEENIISFSEYQIID